MARAVVTRGGGERAGMAKNRGGKGGEVEKEKESEGEEGEGGVGAEKG